MQTSEPISGGPATRITAIVPARNEEAVIETCVRSLAVQTEIRQIIVVNDQSTDRTSEVLEGLARTIPTLQILATEGVPLGWVGKNYAVWQGAQNAVGDWLLFTDADAELMPGAAARALGLAKEHGAALVSFSPEQVTQTWYEKALIPFVYCRLAKYFSYAEVNKPQSGAAAANGQFLMIRADVYRAMGGHGSVSGEVLEDVALAKLTKAAGYSLWFGPGKGVVRVRMYRSFADMWEGWRKNLYLLIGGRPGLVFWELLRVLPWAAVPALLLGPMIPSAYFVAAWLALMSVAFYGVELSSNHFRVIYILYYVPAVILYTAVLWASYRAHTEGYVKWKGRRIRLPRRQTREWF